MPPAIRVTVVPPQAWDEARLLAAARALPAPAGELRPGDALGDLVVVGVEPAPGAEATRETAVEILPEPRPLGGATLDLAILLDASESMAQPWSPEHTRWSAAAEALLAFLKEPGVPARLVTLFLYARGAQLVAGPVASSALPLPEVTPRGRSMTGTALNEALAYLARHASPASGQAVLILSDGAGEVAELERAGQRARRLGVPVHVLLFSPVDDVAFEKLARATGGTVQRATRPPSFALRHDPRPKEPSP